MTGPTHLTLCSVLQWRGVCQVQKEPWGDRPYTFNPVYCIVVERNVLGAGGALGVTGPTRLTLCTVLQCRGVYWVQEEPWG